jgi:hypothetical protein
VTPTGGALTCQEAPAALVKDWNHVLAARGRDYLGPRIDLLITDVTQLETRLDGCGASGTIPALVGSTAALKAAAKPDGTVDTARIRAVAAAGNAWLAARRAVGPRFAAG